jgi:hypothetical protein
MDAPWLALSYGAYLFRIIEAFPLATLPPIIPYCCCIARIALLFLVDWAVAYLEEVLFGLTVG